MGTAGEGLVSWLQEFYTVVGLVWLAGVVGGLALLASGDLFD